ncbi:hypothetical protein RPE78_09175 [Thioclava litoralis]|uniref:Uncharacterized protein n=1 Tax=Thioclava litoralis TaxID=3076557 RepID=A0ABZ1DWM7_9RHOB|nr:hypothetical protein RPE78_09175 [Thioclava sp. FTW29]
MKETTKAGWFAFVRNVGATVTAAGVIWGAMVWTLQPRIEGWLSGFIAAQIGVTAADLRDVRTSIEQQQSTIATISETQARVAETVNKVVERIASLEKAKALDSSPPIRFASIGNSVSAGRIGGLVFHEWRMRKLRDCGTPRSRAYFVNGGGRVHLFTGKSNSDGDGWTVPMPLDDTWQVSRFSARIPADDGVEPTGDGLAMAFLVVDWPEKCPNVPPLRSPEVPFRILP